MTHEPFSNEISAWTREMSAPASRRSVSLRRPIVNSGLSIGTMRRPSASVTTRRGAGGMSTIRRSAHYIFGGVTIRTRNGPPKTDLLQGTLDLLILRTLASGDMHGWGISQRLQQISRDVLQVTQGSLYPALYRLEQQGWIESSWGDSEHNRRAKFYALTRSGRKQLAEETANWERITAAVARVLLHA